MAEQAPKQQDAREAARKGLRGRTAQSLNAVRDELNKQDKMRIFIPRPAHVKKGQFHKVPVTINDYRYEIPTGVWCLVPEEVYLVLVRAGLITPQREEDECEVPAIVTMNDSAYDLMDAGSANNPVVIS